MALTVTTKSGRGLLSKGTKGRVELPPRLHIYGLEKTGKSTFGAESPGPAFIGAENGTSELDVFRMPEPRNFQDVIDSVQELIAEPHDYKTCVIDTLDWLEPHIWDVVCREHNAKNIEEVMDGFQKGYGPGGAIDIWRALLAKLDELRHKRGMGITLLSHAVVRNFKNPQGADFGEYAPKIHAKAAALVNEWVDAILFTKYATTAVAEKGAGKAKKTYGLGDATVVMHTQRQAAFQAGNRYGLPESMEMRYAAFAEAMKDARASGGLDGAKVEAAQAECYRLIAKLAPEVQEKARPNVGAAGSDLGSLEVIRARAATLVHVAQRAQIAALLEDVMDVAVTSQVSVRLEGATEATLSTIIDELRERLNIARANGETT